VWHPHNAEQAFAAGILALTTALLFLRLRGVVRGKLSRATKYLDDIRASHEILTKKITEVDMENTRLRGRLDQTIALYDITKDLCTTLNEEELFALFCDRARSYIPIHECILVRDAAELEKYKECTVIPLEINKQVSGYLVAGGVKDEDKETFNILSQQFILGIKRVLLYQKVQELAITDSLTGVFSRRYYLERLAEELERSVKFNHHFSFLMIDVDRFKYFNDNYGHLVGDAILKTVAKTTRDCIRQIDLIGKYGGDEFSAILIETDKTGAPVAAERIRQAIENRLVRVYDEDLHITVSIGISVFPEDAKDLPTLIDRADKALYEAKKQGRNRVSVFGQHEKGEK